MTDTDELAERIARAAHHAYEVQAKANGWESQPSTRGKDFDEIPVENRATMLATFRGLLDAGVIVAGPAVVGGIREEET
jgi:hypothetical protein